jgi:hypothetical protein
MLDVGVKLVADVDSLLIEPEHLALVCAGDGLQHREQFIQV